MGPIKSQLYFYTLTVFVYVNFILFYYYCYFFAPQLHRYYRSSGHTLQEAGAEAAKAAASNKAVRSAVKQTVQAGVSATVAGQNE